MVVLLEMTQFIFYVWNKVKVDNFIAYGTEQIFMGSNSIHESKSFEEEIKTYNLMWIFHREIHRHLDIYVQH